VSLSLAMSSVTIDLAGGALPAAGARAAMPSERFGHRPAVVLSGSESLRRCLERALIARGAAVANLRTLPAVRQVQDLLASGLILLAPPDLRRRSDATDSIQVTAAASTRESAVAVMEELERHGVLASRDLLYPGEGI